VEDHHGLTVGRTDLSHVHVGNPETHSGAHPQQERIVVNEPSPLPLSGKRPGSGLIDEHTMYVHSCFWRGRNDEYPALVAPKTLSARNALCEGSAMGEECREDMGRARLVEQQADSNPP